MVACIKASPTAHGLRSQNARVAKSNAEAARRQILTPRLPPLQQPPSPLIPRAMLPVPKEVTNLMDMFRWPTDYIEALNLYSEKSGDFCTPVWPEGVEATLLEKLGTCSFSFGYVGVDALGSSLGMLAAQLSHSLGGKQNAIR